MDRESHSHPGIMSFHCRNVSEDSIKVGASVSIQGIRPTDYYSNLILLDISSNTRRSLPQHSYLKMDLPSSKYFHYSKCKTAAANDPSSPQGPHEVPYPDPNKPLRLTRG